MSLVQLSCGATISRYLSLKLGKNSQFDHHATISRYFVKIGKMVNLITTRQLSDTAHWLVSEQMIVAYLAAIKVRSHLLSLFDLIFFLSSVQCGRMEKSERRGL